MVRRGLDRRVPSPTDGTRLGSEGGLINLPPTLPRPGLHFCEFCLGLRTDPIEPGQHCAQDVTDGRPVHAERRTRSDFSPSERGQGTGPTGTTAHHKGCTALLPAGRGAPLPRPDLLDNKAIACFQIFQQRQRQVLGVNHVLVELPDPREERHGLKIAAGSKMARCGSGHRQQKWLGDPNGSALEIVALFNTVDAETTKSSRKMTTT